MKKIILSKVWRFTRIIFLFLLCVSGKIYSAPTFPALTGRVVDEAKILSAQTEAKLTSLLKQHEEKTTNQVVVVTIKSLEGYAIEDYGYQLGRYWGIGQKQKNNGALLIIAPSEKEVRVEVGYGLEGTLTDALSKHIIEQEIIPYFKKNDFNTGIQNGTQAILNVIQQPQQYSDQRTTGAEKKESHDYSVFSLIPFFFLLMLIIELFGIHRKSRIFSSTSLGGFFGLIAWTITGSVIFGLVAFVIVFLFAILGGGRGGFGGNGSGIYSGGGSWGGGSSGGFGGGGGSFGGGGASGRW